MALTPGRAATSFAFATFGHAPGAHGYSIVFARAALNAQADAIYADWEEFARYGFNKSHAADYGVIAVETAYLKAHYTAEYMAALLSASAGQTEKVALYVADAR